MNENRLKNARIRDTAWGGGSESLRGSTAEPRPGSLSVRAKLEVRHGQGS